MVCNYAIFLFLKGEGANSTRRTGERNCRSCYRVEKKNGVDLDGQGRHETGYDKAEARQTAQERE